MKKKILSFMLVICWIVPITFFLVGCVKDDDSNKLYKIVYLVDNAYSGYTEAKIEDYDPLRTASKEGHTFVGWYLDAGFETPFIPSRDLTTERTIYLYGKFEENQHIKVCYHLNGGTNSMFNNTEIYINEDQTVTINDPSKTGFTFDGWYLDKDFTTEFNESICLDDYANGEIICLYAKWI